MSQEDEHERHLAMAVARGVVDTVEHAMQLYRFDLAVAMAGLVTGAAQLLQRRAGISYTEALGKVIEAAQRMRLEAVLLEGRLSKGGSG